MSVCVHTCEAGCLGEKDLCMVHSGWRRALPTSNTNGEQAPAAVDVVLDMVASDH